MKEIIYLIAISFVFAACDGVTSPSNNKKDVLVDSTTSDMGPTDVSGDVCVPISIETISEEECSTAYSCEMIDDNCGGEIERCTCACSPGDSCGIENLGTCVDDVVCKYSFDELGDILEGARNVVFVKDGGIGGDGSKINPFGTYAEALTVAGNKDVVLLGGSLNEQIIVKNGVSVIGGWDESWRPIEQKSNISPSIDKMDVSKPWAGLIAEGVSDKTIIFKVNVVSPNNIDGSAFGLFVSRSNELSLLSVSAIAGNAGKGRDGIKGSKGGDGQDGLPVVPNIGVGNPLPSAIAINPECELKTKGGEGGRGEETKRNPFRTLDPSDGLDGSLGYPVGGRGGNRAFLELDIRAGAGADSPFPITSGDPGEVGSEKATATENGFDLSNVKGGNGLSGEDGRGGGGGGGNSFEKYNGTNNDNENYTGAAGGGGGAGGCGGKGGKGGNGGYYSVGFYAYNSTLLIDNSTFESGIGGAGGTGGDGGKGGKGGKGALGSNDRCLFYATGCRPDPDPLNKSGDGGSGSDGSFGGDGAGGNGGDSYGGFCSASTITKTNVLFSAGIGGVGGLPSGNVGVVSEQIGCE